MLEYKTGLVTGYPATIAVPCAPCERGNAVRIDLPHLLEIDKANDLLFLGMNVLERFVIKLDGPPAPQPSTSVSLRPHRQGRVEPGQNAGRIALRTR